MSRSQFNATDRNENDGEVVRRGSWKPLSGLAEMQDVLFSGNLYKRSKRGMFQRRYFALVRTVYLDKAELERMRREHKMGRNTADLVIHSCDHAPIKETYSLQYYKNKAAFDRRGNSLVPKSFCPPIGRLALGRFIVELGNKYGRYELLIKLYGNLGEIDQLIHDEKHRQRRIERNRKRAQTRKGFHCMTLWPDDESDSDEDCNGEKDSGKHWALHCDQRVEAEHWLQHLKKVQNFEEDHRKNNRQDEDTPITIPSAVKVLEAKNKFKVLMAKTHTSLVEEAGASDTSMPASKAERPCGPSVAEVVELAKLDQPPPSECAPSRGAPTEPASHRVESTGPKESLRSSSTPAPSAGSSSYFESAASSPSTLPAVTPSPYGCEQMHSTGVSSTGVSKCTNGSVGEGAQSVISSAVGQHFVHIYQGADVRPGGEEDQDDLPMFVALRKPECTARTGKPGRALSSSDTGGEKLEHAGTHGKTERAAPRSMAQHQISYAEVKYASGSDDSPTRKYKYTYYTTAHSNVDENGDATEGEATDVEQRERSDFDTDQSDLDEDDIGLGVGNDNEEERHQQRGRPIRVKVRLNEQAWVQQVVQTSPPARTQDSKVRRQRPRTVRRTNTQAGTSTTNSSTDMHKPTHRLEPVSVTSRLHSMPARVPSYSYGDTKTASDHSHVEAQSEDEHSDFSDEPQLCHSPSAHMATGLPQHQQPPAAPQAVSSCVNSVDGAQERSSQVGAMQRQLQLLTVQVEQGENELDDAWSHIHNLTVKLSEAQVSKKRLQAEKSMLTRQLQMRESTAI